MPPCHTVVVEVGPGLGGRGGGGKVQPDRGGMPPDNIGALTTGLLVTVVAGDRVAVTGNPMVLTSGVLIEIVGVTDVTFTLLDNTLVVTLVVGGVTVETAGTGTGGVGAWWILKKVPNCLDNSEMSLSNLSIFVIPSAFA